MMAVDFTYSGQVLVQILVNKEGAHYYGCREEVAH